MKVFHIEIKKKRKGNATVPMLYHFGLTSDTKRRIHHTAQFN